jgi:hypothetical protein
LETAIFCRLYKRDHLCQVLLTFGLILVLEELPHGIGGVIDAALRRLAYRRTRSEARADL